MAASFLKVSLCDSFAYLAYACRTVGNGEPAVSRFLSLSSCFTAMRPPLSYNRSAACTQSIMVLRLLGS